MSGEALQLRSTANKFGVKAPRSGLAPQASLPYRSTRGGRWSLQPAESASPVVPVDAEHRRPSRSMSIVVGALSSCVVSALLAAAPRTGIAFSLLCGAGAVASFSGRLRISFLSRGLAVWLAVTASLGMFMSVAALGAERSKEAKRLAAAAQAAAEADAREKEGEQLRGAANDVMTEGRAAIAHARSALDGGKYEDVEAAMGGALSQLENLAALVPPVEGAGAVRDEAAAVAEEARRFLSAKGSVARALQHAEITGADLLAYDAQLQADQAALAGVTGAPLAKYGKELRRAQGAVDRRRKAIAKEVAAAKREASKRSATVAACGDMPDSNSWGFRRRAEVFLKETAHDPDSLEVESCIVPVLSADRCWVSKCAVRGKNAFGARVLNVMNIASDRTGIVAAVPAR
jgi:hypothetical protein